MRLYINDVRFRQIQSSTPAALLERELNMVQEQMANSGIFIAGRGRGFVDCQLDASKRQSIFQFLNSQNFFACCDIQPADVVPLMGARNLDSLVIVRALEQDNSYAVANLSRLLPAEVMDRLTETSFALQAAAPEPVSEDEKFIAGHQASAAAFDLENTGLIGQESNFLEPKPQPDPVLRHDYGLSEEEPTGDPFDYSGPAGF